MKRTTIKSTLLAIVGALAVVGPQLLNLLADMKSPRAALIASAVGFVVALAVNGKAVALINLFIPDTPGAQPGSPLPTATPTPVTVPNPTGGQGAGR
jgi:hypothetical protein